SATNTAFGRPDAPMYGKVTVATPVRSMVCASPNSRELAAFGAKVGSTRVSTFCGKSEVLVGLVAARRINGRARRPSSTSARWFPARAAAGRGFGPSRPSREATTCAVSLQGVVGQTFALVHTHDRSPRAWVWPMLPQLKAGGSHA